MPLNQKKWACHSLLIFYQEETRLPCSHYFNREDEITITFLLTLVSMQTGFLLTPVHDETMVFFCNSRTREGDTRWSVKRLSQPAQLKTSERPCLKIKVRSNWGSIYFWPQQHAPVQAQAGTCTQACTHPHKSCFPHVFIARYFLPLHA